MSWERFKQNILRRANSPESILDIDTVAKLWATEYDECMKRGGDVTNLIPIEKGNVEIMEQLIKAALIQGQNSQTPYDLVGALGQAVISYWTGATMKSTIPTIPAPLSIANIGVTSNVVINPGQWKIPSKIPSVGEVNPYEKLDWDKIPLDKNSKEVQEIINPDINEINTTLLNDIDVDINNPDTYPAALNLDNTVSEILDEALYEQGIFSAEPDEPLKKEEQAKLIKSGYSTIQELLKIAAAWAPKLGKSPRVNYGNMTSSYIKGVHGLCPQGTQAVIVALTGIKELGTISGNADWFSFKRPSTGGGISSFAKKINGKTYYNDKVKIGDSYTLDSEKWQVGDVVAMGYLGVRPYGHIQVWTGFRWMSDFSQKQIQRNSVDTNTIALWRLNDNGIEAVNNVKNR